MAKIRENGVPLAEFAGVKPLYGIKTGLNEAFLIDTPTKDRLVREDPRSAEIIKPYLRGQDIKRWSPEWRGLWMIFLSAATTPSPPLSTTPKEVPRASHRSRRHEAARRQAPQESGSGQVVGIGTPLITAAFERPKIYRQNWRLIPRLLWSRRLHNKRSCFLPMTLNG